MKYVRKPSNGKYGRHGYHRTPTYSSWVNMRTRCENPNSTQWKWYGAKGVTVCDRWKTFALFLEDVGPRPSTKHTLDRIDGLKGYEPGNVRWVEHQQQCRNRSSNRAVVREDGVAFNSLSEAAESVGGNIGGVWDACNGHSKQHRGYKWSYA